MNPPNFQFFYRDVLKKWFGSDKGRPFIEYALDKISENWDKNIFVVEAPTGYGKTSLAAALSLYAIHEELKIILVYPLRALLEDQYSKFVRIAPVDIVGKRYMHNPDSKYLIKPITLTTIDTLSLNLLGSSPEDLSKIVKRWDGTIGGSLGHYLFAWSSVLLSNIVLDEVHLLADSTKSLNFLFALMKIAVKYGQKLFLMTATLPDALKDVIKSNLGEYVCMIEFDEGMDKNFVGDRESKEYEIEVVGLKKDEKFSRIEGWIKDQFDEFSRVLVVFNTVNDAVRFYRHIIKKFPGVPKLLLHSRFVESDREGKMKCLREIISRNESYIIVTTQVIEAGVDISSNKIITEIAPANSLIQRFGRFMRYDEKKGKAYVWYEVNDEGNLKSFGKEKLYKVYDLELVEKTLEFLKKVKNSRDLNMHLPGSYKQFLNSVYSCSDFRIDISEVHDFIRIVFTLESMPFTALEKLIELEGSFVRDLSLLPAIPSSLQENVDLSTIWKNIFPMSISVLKRFKKVKALLRKREKGKSRIIVEKCDLVSPKKILKKVLRGDILAFIIPCKYDKEMGAVWGLEEDEM